jgi:hypothetical protein
MKFLTVYAPDGTPHEVDNLNALDLTRDLGYTFKNPIIPETAIPAPVEVTAPVEEAPEELEVPESPEESPVSYATLEEEALEVADMEVEEYLNTKDPSVLRTMAEKRYDEKIDGRTGKAKIIEKMLEWEEEKLSAEAE